MGGQVRCHWSQSRLKSVKLGGETEIGGCFSGLRDDSYLEEGIDSEDRRGQF